MWAREMADEILPEMPDFHVAFRDLLHAVNLRHGTDGFTSPFPNVEYTPKNSYINATD
jgi:hypothetical protein